MGRDHVVSALSQLLKRLTHKSDLINNEMRTLSAELTALSGAETLPRDILAGWPVKTP